MLIAGLTAPPSHFVDKYFVFADVFTSGGEVNVMLLPFALALATSRLEALALA